MANTKERHREILAAAVRVLEIFGGVETIDALFQDEHAKQLRKMADNVVGLTNCTGPPARSNVALAMRRARFAIMQERGCSVQEDNEDNWGGSRPNTGPDPWPEDQKRQQVSTRLAQGSKELFQAIAKVKELPGWGRAVDLAGVSMVENDPELRGKLAEMGIVLKSKSYLSNKSKE